MSMIRTAIIGYGRSGRFLHGAGLKGNAESFNVVAVASASQESRDKAGEDFSCPTYADYRKMLTEHPLHLVVIVSRNDQHCEMACEALRAGANVLVTKPIGINKGEVEKMFQVAAESGKKIFPYFPARWGTDFNRIKDIVDAGEIGSVFAVRRSFYGFATRDDWQTRVDAGGGIILNWATHLIDPAMQVAGGKVKAVFGTCSRVLNPGDAEDQFYSVLLMDNGVRVHSEWTFSPKSLQNWFVQGTKGCIIASGRELEIHAGEPSKPADPTVVGDMSGDGQLEVRTELVGEDVFGDPVVIYADVARDLNGEAIFPVGGEEAVLMSAVMDAVKQSQRELRMINLT